MSADPAATTHTDPAAPNVIPSRYRQVAVSSVDSLDPERLVEHFTHREVYFRTRFVIARHGDRVSLLEVEREPSDELFTLTRSARVLAGPDECAFVVDGMLDTAVPSELAAAAERVRGARCVVVEGAYSHISFILNAEPLRLRVLDVMPPDPPKLVDQVRRVLAMAEDLPPVVVEADVIDTRQLLRDAYAELPTELLIPCRASGMEFPGSNVSFLDERPERRSWTLLGCQRSEQIHEWFYDSRPERIDICPRERLVNGAHPATLTRCCLVQEGVERDRGSRIVPWGASLAEVHTALEELLGATEVPWTRT